MKPSLAFLALMALALTALAQTPPATGDNTTVTNRDELIRELLRRATVTNAPVRPLRSETDAPVSPAPTPTPAPPPAPTPPPAIAPALPTVPGTATAAAAPAPVTNVAVPASAPAAPVVPPAPAQTAAPATAPTAPPAVPSLPIRRIGTPAGTAGTTGAPPAIGATPPGIGAPTTPPTAPAAPATTAAATPAVAAALAKPAEPIYVNKEEIKLKAMELEEFLEKFYAVAVGRTIIRPAALPAAKLTLTLNNPLTRSEYIQLLDSVLALNGVSMIPVGDKFVKAVPTTQALTEAASVDKRKPEDLPESGQYLTHVVQLKYVRPSDVQPVIQPFAKTPGGIVPIEASGVLVLRDFTENIKRMLEMIEKVDIAMAMDIQSEVIPIKYALAGEIASVLSSLQGAGGGVTTGTGAGASGGTRRGALGASTGAGFGGGGGTVGPSTVGGYSSGTLSGRQGTVGGTGAVGGFGQPGAVGGTGGTFGTAGATQSSFQNRLQQIVNRAATGAGQGGFQILGDVRIITVDTANSLLVFATAQDMTMIKDVIAKLDVVQPQVLIESIIMEVSLSKGLNLSVSAGQTPQQYNQTLRGGGSLNGGRLGAAQNFLGALTNLAQFPGGDGFAWFGNINDEWFVAVNAAANDGRVNVLSRPRIQTSHAVEASLFIGDTVPYVTGTISDISGSRAQYQQLRVGITLNVLPLINPEGLVVMDISQSIQQLGNAVQIDGNPVPTTTERSAAAKVAVRDGEAVMLGGLISNQQSKTDAGVPLLKDIPGLGALFRSSNTTSSRVELIVLMRPLVLPTPEAASIMAQNERETLPGIKSAIDDTTQAVLDLRKNYGIDTNRPYLPTVTAPQ